MPVFQLNGQHGRLKVVFAHMRKRTKISCTGSNEEMIIYLPQGVTFYDELPSIIPGLSMILHYNTIFPNKQIIGTCFAGRYNALLIKRYSLVNIYWCGAFWLILCHTCTILLLSIHCDLGC